MYKILNNDIRQKEYVNYLATEIFGDTKPYVDFFIEKRYNLKDCFVLTDDDLPIGMLHSFPCIFTYEGKSYSCRYLYYIGIQKQYRNLGLATKLINYTIDVQHRAGTDIFCLLPANDGLYNFYKKIGFSEFFKIDNINIPIEKNLPIVVFDDVDDVIDFEAIIKIRDRFLSSCLSYIRWDKNAVKYAFEECRFTGGRAVSFKSSLNKNCLEYALIKGYDIKTRTVFVNEFAGEDFTSLASCIQQLYADAENITIRYPARQNCSGLKFGMVKSFIPIKFNSGDKYNFMPYLGLTMD